MKPLRKFLALFRRRRFDADMAAEMRAHLDAQTQRNLAAGLSPDDARAAAHRQFGGVAQIQEQGRDARGGRWLDELGQDVRFAARTLRKRPGYTTVVVATLALGTGTNTTIFSLIDAALLRGLPYTEPDRLAVIWADNPGLKLGLPFIPPANADVAAWRDTAQSFARIAAFVPRTADLAAGGDPERVGAVGVTAGFFETLGVAPMLGRTLRADEEMRGGAKVALLSHGLWQRRFGGDRALLGQTVSIDGDAVTVVGILPPEFDFPRAAEWPALFPFAPRTEIWLPLSFDTPTWQSRDERGLVVFARLNSGVSVRQAQAELDAFSAREAAAHPNTHQGWSLRLVALRDQLTGKSRPALLILSAAVGLLLLIACVNVANLLIAQGVARQPELAMRAALGAGRARLIRQLLTECVVLAALGSTLGLVVAAGGLEIFLALNPATHSRLNEAALNPAALIFAALAALGTSVGFGLVPALQASRIDLRKSFAAGGRGAESAVRERVRSWLVGVQVALAVILLTTAGLMMRSFLRVQAVQPGFQPDAVLAFDVQLPETRYRDNAAKVRFFQQLETRLQAVPGVRAAGAISYLPLGGGDNVGIFVVESETPIAPGQEPHAERRWVTPGYFATMGIPLRQGRVFQPTDVKGQPSVVVINETMARKFFPGRDPVGRRLKIGRAASSSWRTVVGVVADVKSSSLEGEVKPQLYAPQAQWVWGAMTVVLHVEGNPLALAATVRDELRELDALLPVTHLRTMEQVVWDAASGRRFTMAVLTFFAGAALILTLIGLYGVVAFLVSRRSREIGIRIALGAQRNAIYELVIRQGMKPVALGAASGLIGARIASRLVASQLYGISASDPVTLASILALLTVAALIACWLPARRAAKVDPVVALRAE